MSDNSDVFEAPNRFSSSMLEPLQPVLTLQGDWRSQAALAAQLGIRETDQFLTQSGLVHLVCGNPDLPFKQKALNLFGFAAALRLKARSDLILWEHSRFRDELEGQIKNTLSSVKTPQPQGGAGLQICAPIHLYLRQAGVQIDTSVALVSLKDELLLEMLTVQPASLSKVVA